MKLGRLNHIGIAVPSIAQAITHYREVLGAGDIAAPFDLPEHGVTVCFVNPPAGGTQIELIAPLGDASPIAGFLAKHPLGGQHHLCFEVPDMAQAREWFAGQNKRILGPTRIGAHGVPVFFLHPADMGGVLTEIMQAPAVHG